MSELPEYRQPWWHRWTGLLGEPRQRWRALDDRERAQARLVFRVAIVGVLIYIAWPLALLVAVLFGVNYVKPQIPERFAWARRAIVPTIILIVAVTYPFYVANLPVMQLFGAFPDVNTAVIMGVYVMMAIGLNIVVGYAGLLDLGYVAFYAVGAYTCAWFASVQFANHHVNFGAVGVASTTPGIHISIWLLVFLAGIVTAVIGIVIGLPTLRLRGDYLAIVTLGFGEILPQVANNGDSLGGFNLTNGPNGITPIDAPGFGNVSFQTGYNSFFTGPRLYFWFVLLLVMITTFCSLRLRDSRLGRAWIAIGDGRSADAHENVGLRDRGLLRRRRRRLLRELQELDFSERLLLQHLRVHPFHGHPRRDGQRLGRHLRRRVPRLPEPGGAREHRPQAQPDVRNERRRPAVPVRDLRRDHRARDADPPRGVDP
jgi:ABC-type branched-subunit amino acid transport system permease subunit